MKSRILHHWDIMVCVLLALGFIARSEIDLAASALFYRPGDGFFLRNEAWVQWIHHGIPLLATAVSVVLVGILGLGFVPAFSGMEKHRRPALYLLLTLALGSGLLVNGMMKSHSGRARPADVVQFGGDKTFTPAVLIGDQCSRNCSFVCGHASLGFALCAFGFLTRRRIWFGLAFSLGTLLGFARIVHGKHFLSDVLFSFFAVYFCAKLLHFLLYDSASPLRQPRWAGLFSCPILPGPSRCLETRAALDHPENQAIAFSASGSEP